MRRNQWNIVAVAAMATMLVIGGNAAAHADEGDPAVAPKRPSAGGSAIAPENGEVTIDDTATGGGIGPMVEESVGGGTWNHGSQYGVWPPKTCWSDYKHDSKYHSSTVVMGSANVIDYASAWYWSEATATGGAAYVCYAYWNTY
jgi:lactococcin 972 family bacteriocin